MRTTYDVIDQGLRHLADRTSIATYALIRYRATRIYALRHATGATRSVDQRWALARHLVKRRTDLGAERGFAKPISQEAAAREVGITGAAYCKYEQRLRSPLP
ncbi:MAG TPA: hypothetical protein VNA25_17200, partial [Phycisphaerae bacterium]|nr:hypothetical protein [Phycisphaerae bacterium]